MKILRATDIVKIKIDDVTISVQPLSYAQRVEMGKFVKVKDGKEDHDYGASVFFTVKHTVKEVSGLHTSDGEYSVSFDGEFLTDECTTEVIGIIENLEGAYLNIARVAGNAGKDIQRIVNPETGKSLDGVEVSIHPKIQPPKSTS